MVVWNIKWFLKVDCLLFLEHNNNNYQWRDDGYIQFNFNYIDIVDLPYFELL